MVAAGKQGAKLKKLPDSLLQLLRVMYSKLLLLQYIYLGLGLISEAKLKFKMAF
jgi:hypothetical protein